MAAGFDAALDPDGRAVVFRVGPHVDEREARVGRDPGEDRVLREQVLGRAGTDDAVVDAGRLLEGEVLVGDERAASPDALDTILARDRSRGGDDEGVAFLDRAVDGECRAVVGDLQRALGDDARLVHTQGDAGDFGVVELDEVVGEGKEPWTPGRHQVDRSAGDLVGGDLGHGGVGVAGIAGLLEDGLRHRAAAVGERVDHHRFFGRERDGDALLTVHLAVGDIEGLRLDGAGDDAGRLGAGVDGGRRSGRGLVLCCDRARRDEQRGHGKGAREAKRPGATGEMCRKRMRRGTRGRGFDAGHRGDS